MALPVSVGDEVDADLLNELANRSRKGLCIVRKSTVTSVADGGALLSWDTEDIDTDGWHSTSSLTSRIVPTIPGWYRCTATVHWAGNVNGRRGVAIAINGGSFRYGQIIAATINAVVGVTVTRTIQCNGTTDYLEVSAYQNSGGALNTSDTTGTVFEVEYVRDNV